MVILIAHQMLGKFDSHLEIFVLMDLEALELQMKSKLCDEGKEMESMYACMYVFSLCIDNG